MEILWSGEIDTLTILGLAITLAYLISKLLRQIGLPQVVGFVLTGVLLGNSGLNIIPLSLAEELEFITQISLGFIGLDIGAHLRRRELRHIASQSLLILLCEGLGTALIVASGTYILTHSLPLSLILGALAVATAPAATVEVLAEHRAEGPMTTLLMTVIGLDDTLSLILFSLVLALAEIILGGKAHAIDWGHVVLIPIWEILGAILLGILIGLPFQWILNHLKERHAVYAFIVGVAFLTTGLSLSLNISMVLSMMTMGIIVGNVKVDNSAYVRCVVERVGPVAYILFFILVGAHLQVSTIPKMGLVGIAYISLRAIGKLGGTRIGALLAKTDRVIQRYIGLGLLAQAGVVMGLSLEAAERFTAYGTTGETLAHTLINVIAASVFVLEIVGPIATKFAVLRSGEAWRAPSPEDPTPIEQPTPLEELSTTSCVEPPSSEGPTQSG